MSNPVENDRIFKALGHHRRRDMLDLLKDNPQTTGALCAVFSDIDRCTVMQHLKVLEDADLVRSTKTGRVRTYALHAAPLRRAEGWLADQRSHWESRLDRLDAFLLTLEDDE